MYTPFSLNPFSLNTPFFEMYRVGLRGAADALEAQARSLRELADAGSLDEAMALYTRRAGEYHRTLDLWSGVWRAAGDTQSAAAGTDPIRAATASLERVRVEAAQLADRHAGQRAA